MKFFISFLLFLAFFSIRSQDTIQPGKITTSVYLEAYYGFDEAGALRENRPGFLYNHTRINRPAINLAFLRSAYVISRFRMNVAFMTGTYAARNLAAEDPIFRNLFEANLGVALDKQERIWLDVGVMPSHIGMESAVGWENPTLTRCLVSENTPYYESGAKLSLKSKSGQWYIALLGLNGWQRIMVDGGILPGGGTQLTFDNGKCKINHSTFIGDVSPDKKYLTRVYQNLYATYRLNEQLTLIGGFDFGMQQNLTNKGTWENWHTWFGMVRFAANEKIAFSLRAEQFVDPGQLVAVVNPRDSDTGGASLYSASLNGDYKYNKNLMMRLELKHIGSSNDVKIGFERGNLLQDYFGVTFSLCAGF
jgi:hypothetical protein